MPKQQAVSQLDMGKKAIHGMAGCYLVDYNYTETEALKSDYKRDKRIYDVDKTKAVKEWIYAEDLSPNRVRLQHLLFATDANGKIIPETQLKHQVEDWEFGATAYYEYEGSYKWVIKPLPVNSQLWTRKVTNLDDGLRYQCAAPWAENTAFPEWSCTDNYAPIPGRETRDMGRKDYNALKRSTRVIVYKGNWLERQENVKISDQKGVQTPLAKELGKNWYVRLPDADCQPMISFAESHRPFWALLRESWDEVLNANQTFIETPPAGRPPRFAKMMEVEKEFQGKNLKDPKVRESAHQKILQVIQDYRESDMATTL